MSFHSPSPIADDASVLIPSQAFISTHKGSLLCTCSDGGTHPFCPYSKPEVIENQCAPKKSLWPMMDGFGWIPQLLCPIRPADSVESPSEVTTRMKLHLPSALTSWWRIPHGRLIFIRCTSWEAVSRMSMSVIQGSKTIQEAWNMCRQTFQLNLRRKSATRPKMKWIAYGCGEFPDCGSI